MRKSDDATNCLDVFRGRKFSEVFRKMSGRDVPSSALVLQEFNEEEVRRQLRLGVPIVIQNLVSVESQREVWEKLERACGHELVEVRYGDFHRPENYPHQRKVQSVVLSDFLRSSMLDEQGRPVYLGNCLSVGRVASAIAEPLPSLHFDEETEPAAAWLGPAGCVTPLHKDGSDNWVIQLVGHKKWLLFAPQHVNCLYMSRYSADPEWDFAVSAVDPALPDLQRFPEFARAHPIIVTACPGDALYVPAGWSHHVESLDMSLSVNYWRRRQSLPHALEE